MPCEHDPKRRCPPCRKEANRNRMAAKCHEDIEISRKILRDRYAANREKHKQEARDWRKNNPERAREIDSPTGLRFGGKKLAQTLREQDEKCRICAASLIGGFHTDHDHRRPGDPQGNVRSLLCDGCNPGLGSFKDSPALLRRAANYIEDPRLDPTDIIWDF